MTGPLKMAEDAINALVEAATEVVEDYMMENWLQIFNTIVIVWVLADGEAVVMLIGVYYFAMMLASVFIAMDNMGR